MKLFWCLTAWAIGQPWLAHGQVALRNQMSLQTLTETRRLAEADAAYNLKLGDLRLRMTPAFNTQWNDNVQLGEEDRKSDVILRPTLGVEAIYPVSRYNVLHLNVTTGYQQYLREDDLSSWYVQSGSELAFDLMVKNIAINLHEVPSYVLDAAPQTAVAGSGNFGTFRNTVGLSVAMNLENVRLAVGYDHLLVKSITDEFTSQDQNSELGNALMEFQLNESLRSGLEGSAGFTAYDERTLNDHANYSLGVFADWQAGQGVRVRPRLGYTTFKFEQTSQSIQTSDLNSWYADLNLTLQPAQAVTCSLEAGHEIRTGLAADIIEVSYFRPGVQWDVTGSVSLASALSYEHGRQGMGNITGNQTENYDWFGLGGHAAWRLLKRLTLALDYRLVLRSSDLDLHSYRQNVVGFTLTYQTP